MTTQARVVLRPLGNPLPLGFLALAGGTLLLAGLQLGWLDPPDARDVGIALVAFVAPLQLVASVLGFLARDPVAGTGMGILTGTWLTVGLVTLSSPPGATSAALGLLLLLSGAAMLVPASGAALGKLVVAAVLTTTSVRFELTGVFELTGSDGWGDAAGVVGLVLCALAVYAALAMMLEDLAPRPPLPLGRRGAGRLAVRGDLADQLRGVESEPGARRQL